MLIRAFCPGEPGVTFDLQQGSRAFCLELLASGTADLALVAPPPAPSSAIGAEVLYSEPLKLVVPAGHRLDGTAGIRLDAVRDEPFIMLEPGYGMRSIVESLCRRAGFRPRVAFQGQDLHTVRGLVSAGLGVAVAPAQRSSGQATQRGGLGLGRSGHHLARSPPRHRAGLAQPPRRLGAGSPLQGHGAG